MRKMTVVIKKEDEIIKISTGNNDNWISENTDFDALKTEIEKRCAVSLQIEEKDLEKKLKIEYQVEYEIYFEWLYKYLKQTGIAEISALNSTLLSQYNMGAKSPSMQQLKKIESAIKEFGKELQKVTIK